VLVEGDDTNEPIADVTRSILDGHIVLSRRLTSRGHYPPIDVLQSLSRTMPRVATDEQIEMARDLRELQAAYSDVEDLVNIGAYKAGSSPISDRAIRLKPSIDRFLRQTMTEGEGYDSTIGKLRVDLSD
jgi:flagellum-specific ATP synthase